MVANEMGKGAGVVRTLLALEEGTREINRKLDYFIEGGMQARKAVQGEQGLRVGIVLSVHVSYYDTKTDNAVKPLLRPLSATVPPPPSGRSLPALQASSWP